MTIKVALEHRTGAADVVQARTSNNIGAPGILDLRRVRTVLR